MPFTEEPLSVSDGLHRFRLEPWSAKLLILDVLTLVDKSCSTAPQLGVTCHLFLPLQSSAFFALC